MSKYSLSLEPTNENIKESLNEDVLGLNEWISKCLNVLLDMEDSIVAIDAKWGNGKTFIAKQMQMIINEKWELQAGKKTQSDLSKVPNLDFNELPLDSYYAIYYNAWEYDNENDPMVSFIYYLLKMLNKNIKSSQYLEMAKSFILNVVNKISNGWIKINTESKENDVEKILSSVLTSEVIKKEIENLLTELKNEKCNKLIIFIDELDRCRPTYALKVIELLKHYFKRNDILVVCMCDLEQLAYSVANVYGFKNKAYQYLDKIFDFRFEIPIEGISYSNYIKYRVKVIVKDYYFFDMICLEIINQFKLSLRNIDRFLCYLRNMFIKMDNDEDNFPIRGLVQHFFTPYYLAVKLFDETSYNNLKSYIFNDVLTFTHRENVSRRMDQIYSMALKGDYQVKKLDDYLAHDLKIIMKIINNEKTEDIFYISKNAFYANNLRRIIEKIDLLSYFKTNKEELKHNE